MKRQSKTKKHATKGFDHHCAWREAALKLASCVVATIRTDGKLGMGTGMVMKVVDGKKVIERWDKDFIEALAFIGFDVIDAKKPVAKSRGKLVATPGTKKLRKIAAPRAGARAA